MDNVIDFTNCEKKKKTYEGANGSKICILYNNEQYMLKFPSVSKLNKEISYTNGTISEYLGCHILESLGFETQKTILGTYNKGEKKKIVVACKDFTENNRYTIQPFSALKNTIIDSGHNGSGTELSEVLETIDNQVFYDVAYLKDYFWDLFIGDALIGNWDRHNGNWASLYNAADDSVKLAPIYDCGSSLYPSADLKTIENILKDKEQLLFRVYEIPVSALKMNGTKINYFKFISSLENEDCNSALKRIYPKINIEKINKIIENTPFITDIQKQFFKTMIKARKELILEYSYNKLIKQEIRQEFEGDKLNLTNIESFGKEYLNKVLELSNKVSIKNAALLAHEELIKNNPVECHIKQTMLNNYLNSLNIKNNKDFCNYISELKEKKQLKSIRQKKEHDSRSD